MWSDDVHGGRKERVCVPHDGPDVEVVFPVLDRDVQAVAAQVEVIDDCRDRPVAISVHHVATIAAGEQLGIEVRLGWPRLRMGSGTDGVRVCRRRRALIVTHVGDFAIGVAPATFICPVSKLLTE